MFEKKIIYRRLPCRDKGMGWFQGGNEDLLRILEDKAAKEDTWGWNKEGYIQNYFVDIISAYIKEKKTNSIKSLLLKLLHFTNN